MTLAPGAKPGPYEILSALGAGGMGQVWKARDTLGRLVAIKTSEIHFSERFEREARAKAEILARRSRAHDRPVIRCRKPGAARSAGGHDDGAHGYVFFLAPVPVAQDVRISWYDTGAFSVSESGALALSGRIGSRTGP
jgi:serine/threonine protein kinase